MCSADDKQVGENISPCNEVLTQKPHFPSTHIPTSAFLSSCYLEFQVLGGWKARREEGGGSKVTTASVRRACQKGTPLTTCASLESLQSPDWPSATPVYRKCRGKICTVKMTQISSCTHFRIS